MSPKRKRAANAAVVNVSNASGDSDLASPHLTDSPRTQVASHFSGLEIAETPSPRPQYREDTSDSEAHLTPRKRQKRIGGQRGNQSVGLAIHLPSSPPLSPVSHGANTTKSLEPASHLLSLPSTPAVTPTTSPHQARPSPPARPKRSPSPLRSMSTAPEAAHSSSPQSATNKPRTRPLRSPPPPTATVPASPDATTATPPVGSTQGVKDEETMTWQPYEITGHHIDITQPDDSDGLGINGIGFMPSVQIAEYRRARRKQQVEGWRLRETREARMRRAEKREGRMGFKTRKVERNAVERGRREGSRSRSVSLGRGMGDLNVGGGGGGGDGGQEGEGRKRSVRFEVVGDEE